MNKKLLNEKQIEDLAKQYLRSYPAVIAALSPVGNGGFADDTHYYAHVASTQEDLGQKKKELEKKYSNFRDAYISMGSVPFDVWKKATDSEERKSIIDSSQEIDMTPKFMQAKFARVLLNEHQHLVESLKEKSSLYRLVTPTVKDSQITNNEKGFDYYDPVVFLYALLEKNPENRSIIQQYFSKKINDALNILVRDLGFNLYRQRLLSAPQDVQHIAVSMESKWLDAEVKKQWEKDITFSKRNVAELLGLYIPLAHKLGRTRNAEYMGYNLAHLLK